MWYRITGPFHGHMASSDYRDNPTACLGARDEDGLLGVGAETSVTGVDFSDAVQATAMAGRGDVIRLIFHRTPDRWNPKLWEDPVEMGPGIISVRDFMTDLPCFKDS